MEKGGREQAWWEEADVPGVREYLVRVKIHDIRAIQNNNKSLPQTVITLVLYNILMQDLHKNKNIFVNPT